MKNLQLSLPFLGAGISYRLPISKEIFRNKKEIGVLEIIAEHYLSKRGQYYGHSIEELCENFNVAPHGLNLSICSANLDKEYVSKIKALVDIVRPSYYTDHLALTGCPGIDVGHLSPIVFDKKTLDLIIDNVNYVQDQLGCPLALENITYHFAFSENHYDYITFVNQLVEKTNCGLLVDLTNLYINAINHKFDAKRFIDELPLNNILHVHIAGEYSSHGTLIDGHCCPVQEGTWDLLSYLTKKSQPRAVVLEHDADFPDDFADFIKTIARANSYLINNKTS